GMADKIMAPVNTSAEVIRIGDKDSSDLYKNSSMPRGYVFMAIYKQFDEQVDNFKSLFECMGYEVPKLHINMDHRETQRAIQKFKNKPELKVVDSCIVIIMSDSGHKEFFETYDGKKILTDDIVNGFNNENCPVLMGKPKIFIFDCYRANISVPSVDLSMPQTANENNQIVGNETVKTDGTKTDILIIYSKASDIIGIVRNIFLKYAREMEIEELIRKV
ncbi:unnamed protein product, partial [Meganyctiphanes norvegica]